MNFFLLFVFLISTSISSIQADVFNGFYSGERIGLAVNISDVSSNSNSQFNFSGTPLVESNHSIDVDIYDKNLWGEAFCGYGKTLFRGVYIGG